MPPISSVADRFPRDAPSFDFIEDGTRPVSERRNFVRRVGEGGDCDSLAIRLLCSLNWAEIRACREALCVMGRATEIILQYVDENPNHNDDHALFYEFFCFLVFMKHEHPYEFTMFIRNSVAINRLFLRSPSLLYSSISILSPLNLTHFFSEVIASGLSAQYFFDLTRLAYASFELVRAETWALFQAARVLRSELLFPAFLPLELMPEPDPTQFTDIAVFASPIAGDIYPTWNPDHAAADDEGGGGGYESQRAGEEAHGSFGDLPDGGDSGGGDSERSLGYFIRGIFFHMPGAASPGAGILEEGEISNTDPAVMENGASALDLDCAARCA